MLTWKQKNATVPELLSTMRKWQISLEVEWSLDLTIKPMNTIACFLVTFSSCPEMQTFPKF
jgi:hypothetical protein